MTCEEIYNAVRNNYEPKTAAEFSAFVRHFYYCRQCEEWLRQLVSDHDAELSLTEAIAENVEAMLEADCYKLMAAQDPELWIPGR